MDDELEEVMDFEDFQLGSESESESESELGPEIESESDSKSQAVLETESVTDEPNTRPSCSSSGKRKAAVEDNRDKNRLKKRRT